MIIPVVTCKGRLQHLTQTLPLLVEQFERTVVVDYSCPDRSGKYAAELPGVCVETVQGAQWFHKTHALNLGADRAIDEGATSLLFIDADTKPILGLRSLLESIPDNMMGITGPKTFAHSSLIGLLLVSVHKFQTVNGFDETYIGWGYEDQDMRLRLYCDARCKPYHIPEYYFESIRHENTLRSEYQQQTLIDGAKRNQRLYRTALRERISSNPDFWCDELKQCLPYR